MTRPIGHTLRWLSSRKPLISDIHIVDSSSSSAVKHTLIAVVILLSGAALGGGAARIAESTVAARVTTDAAALDRLSSLAESAALMQASINQALLLAGTERPAALARAEAESAVMVFETSLIAVGDDDVLVESGRWMLEIASNTLSELDSGRPIAEIGTTTPALEASYRAFADLVTARRRSARASIASTAEGEGTAAVALTALVVFLAPALIVFVTVQWVRRRVSKPVPSRTRVEAPPENAGTPEEPTATGNAADPRSGSNVMVERARELVGAGPAADSDRGTVGLLSDASALRSVAQNLVTLDRIRTGTMTITTQATDLRAIVSRIAEHASQMGIHIDVVGERVHGMTDPSRLQEALTNLLAVGRTEGADRMALVVARDGGSATITVAGTGFSMDADLVSDLQDDRAINTANASELSLSVAGHLIRAMSGRIRYHEESGMALLILQLPLPTG